MKHQFLIISIILSSLISWLLWAMLFLHFFESSKEDQIVKQKEKNVIHTAENISLSSLENDITNIVDQVSPSVVSIIIKKDIVIYKSDPWGFFQQATGTIKRKVWGWSGFFIDKNGTILTNKHVVLDKDAQYTVILWDGREYDGRVLALDPINDLAVIKIDASIDNNGEKEVFPVLDVMKEKSDLKIGQFAIALWNALAEFQNSVSLWIISGKNRNIEAEGQSLSGLLQTDAAINPGNSGWPLINLKGEVVGINTAIASGSNGVWFSIALTQDKIDYILQSITESGKIKRPFIGINFVANSPSVAAELDLSLDYWVYIIDNENSIISGTSAAESGLEPGDIIYEVNWEVIYSQQTLSSIIQNSIPGDILKLKILKKSGEKKDIQLTLWAY